MRGKSRCNDFIGKVLGTKAILSFHVKYYYCIPRQQFSNKSLSNPNHISGSILGVLKKYKNKMMVSYNFLMSKCTFNHKEGSTLYLVKNSDGNYRWQDR